MNSSGLSCSTDMTNIQDAPSLGLFGYTIPKREELRHGLRVWRAVVPVKDRPGPWLEWRIMVEYIPAEKRHPKTEVPEWSVHVVLHEPKGEWLTVWVGKPTWPEAVDALRERLGALGGAIGSLC